jgi:predicted small secreted protein
MQHSEDLGRILILVLNAARQSETIISIYKEDLSEFTRTIKEDTISVVKEVVKQEEGAAGSSTSASSEKKRPNAGGTTGRAGISTSSSGLSNFFNFMDSLKDEEEEEVLYRLLLRPRLVCGVRLVC